MRRLAVTAATLVLLACGPDEATGPNDASTFLVIHLTPSEGALTWEPMATGSSSVRLTPPLRWEVQFVAPAEIWNLTANVRLMRGNAACLQSSAYFNDQALRGVIYALRGGEFRLSSRPSPCGDDFTVDAVDVAMTGNGIELQGTIATRRVPCSYRFSRVGAR